MVVQIIGVDLVVVLVHHTALRTSANGRPVDDAQSCFVDGHDVVRLAIGDIQGPLPALTILRAFADLN